LLGGLLFLSVLLSLLCVRDAVLPPADLYGELLSSMEMNRNIHFSRYTTVMLLGMPEAGRRLGMTGNNARRALANAGVPLVKINERAFAVEEKDLETFMQARATYRGRGRPKKQQASQ